LLDQLLDQPNQPEFVADARFLRATIRHRLSDFAGAGADVDAFLAADPPRPQRSDALHLRGLCQLGLGEPAAAAQTFALILDADPQYQSIDRVLYDLAWAFQESGDGARATTTFAKLAHSYPASPLAAECHYRVGDARYAASDFAAAAEDFRAAQSAATDDALREKAIHKLAWCQFERQVFDAAEKTFERQIARHPDGPLADDARIMAAECRFQQKAYIEAADRFAAALNRSSAGESLRAMAWVHAGRAAGQLNQWRHSVDLLNRALGDFPDSPWAAEARCERGTALYELGRLDQAERDFAEVAACDQGVLNARAEFMLGKILVARKQHDDAVRAFFKVAYGHGGPHAPEPLHHWQAEAIYAAACTLEHMKRPDDARKLYQELVERYPASERAALARQSLERILRR
jgi:TolA-binding protein